MFLINLIIILLIVVLSAPLIKKSERCLKESYLEDDFGKQHKLVDQSIFYKRLFIGMMFFCFFLLLTLATFLK